MGEVQKPEHANKASSKNTMRIAARAAHYKHLKTSSPASIFCIKYRRSMDQPILLQVFKQMAQGQPSTVIESLKARLEVSRGVYLYKTTSLITITKASTYPKRNHELIS